MGRVGKEGSDMKSQLVSQICSFSTASIGCAHREYSDSGRSDFIDWYCLLGVGENAGLDVIRKRYHKLALQLHPDKNKHPKAEIAFKLVSQASVCLSDNAKRRAFDLQRLKNFCPKCNRIPYSNGNSPRNSSMSVPKAWNHTAWSRSSRILQSLKDIRERFKEEARVIENCLRTNMGSKTESPVFGSPEYLFRSNTQRKTRRETPIFDPSDYLFQGYPHLRNQTYRKPEHCCFLQRGNSLNYEQGRRRFDSPTFEIRSEITMLKSKSAFLYS